ncbi:tRNA lysidine(34) synthetase TilS [Halovulum sp. GXIMD14794]
MTEETLARQIAEALDPVGSAPLGVAVSGGGDSIALLVLMADRAASRGTALRAVTVDHGLRAESAEEAAQARATAKALGVPHDILRWTGHPEGNLQDAARRARRSLIAGWAREQRLTHVALAHTADDQAETVLMRLARGSGLYGLTGMQPKIEAEGIVWLRPLLNARRTALRDLLRERRIRWAEDPSNEDMRFDRARLRAAMPQLEAIGLSVDRLTETAASLSRAARIVRRAVEALARDAADISPLGYITLDAAKMAAAEPELRLRLLAEGLRWVSGADYTPRLSALEALDHWAIEGGLLDRRTLHGCIVERGRIGLTICREPGRVGPEVAAGEIWDGRWGTAPGEAEFMVSALGEDGIAELPDWRALGHPRTALVTLPAFRNRGALIAAPFALPRKPCHSWLLTAPDRFIADLGPD